MSVDESGEGLTPTSRRRKGNKTQAERRAARRERRAAEGAGNADPAKLARREKRLARQARKAAAGEAPLEGEGRAPDPKVFCIGFNKTGTTSLAAYFRARGLRAKHDTNWPHASHLPNAKSLFKATAFSDGEYANFVKLDKVFPGSLFVLNTRDELSWLRSRIKHVLRYAASSETENSPAKATSAFDLGVIAQDFHAAPGLTIDRWILDRRIYHARVRQYFAGRPNFLEIQVTEDPTWPQKLGAALEAFGFATPDNATAEIPDRNKRSDGNFDDFPLIDQYFQLAAARLEAAGPDDAPISHVDLLGAMEEELNAEQS